MAEIADVVVHREQNDSGDRPLPVPRERRKIGKSSVKPVVKETESKVRLKTNGKPSRRWLSREIDRLKYANVGLQRILHEKEASESKLIETRARLEAELNSFRSDSSTTNREKQRILKQDVFLLKNLVVKLNKELQKYQEKYQAALHREPADDIEIQQSRTPPWIDGELTVLAPLLIAYEESLKEKEELVKETHEKLIKLNLNFKELARENEDLRESIKISEDRGKVTYGEWLTVQKEGSMLKEQNTLLLRQMKLNSTKIQTLKDSFQVKLDEVMVDRDDYFNKFNKTKTELSILKGRFSVMFEEFDKLRNEEQNKIPNAVHTAYITECKRLFEELKDRYDEEKSNLVRKVNDAESENEELERKVSQLSEERQALRSSIEAFGTQVRCLREAFDRALKDREVLKEQLNQAIQFSKDLVLHEEALIKELRQRTEESQFGTKLAGRVESLKRNMKIVEEDTLRQMQALDTDLQSQVRSVGRIKESFSGEISRLKSLLKEKDTFIARLKRKDDGDDSSV